MLHNRYNAFCSRYADIVIKVDQNIFSPIFQLRLDLGQALYHFGHANQQTVFWSVYVWRN